MTTDTVKMEELDVITIKYRDLAGEPGTSPYDSLNYLLDRDDFPVVFGHKLVKLASLIIPEIKHIDTVYARLVRKYGQLTEDKSKFLIPTGSENELKFAEEYEKFLNEPVQIQFSPISLKELSEIKIKSKHLYNLRHFFKD